MPAAHDFIPRPDGDFDSWSAHFAQELAAIGPGLGIDAGDIALVANALDDWTINYAGHVAAAAAARAASASKAETRRALERVIRPIVRRVQASAAATNAARAALGVRVLENGPAIDGAAAPSSSPIVSIDIPARLRHRLRFVDAATPTRSARPVGCLGAEVWVALAEPGTPAGAAPPPSMGAYRFVELSMRGEMVSDYPLADAGRMAFYQLRWLSTRGERGPWSNIASATIAA